MKLADYIRECDGIFAKRLEGVSNAVKENKNRIICLAGPTCSGKTTAAAMLADSLAQNGRTVHIISIDDFYFDREYLHSLSKTGKDGEADYDSEKTVDLSALESFAANALAGREAQCPIFDFKTGSRRGYRRIYAQGDDVFVFEGIQAIYPSVTAMLAPYGGTGIYIAPMTELRHGDRAFFPNDIRLMRRLVRDFNFRATDADFTLTLWRGVRANEEKNIFPYVGNCKYSLDSTHGYEIGVLKPYLEKILHPVIINGGVNAEAARAILEGVADVEAIPSDLIPKKSLYREFV